MKNKKIAIIGCGNLGLSILNGLLTNPLINPKNISITRRNFECLEYLKNKGIDVSSNNSRVIKNSDIIIFALKPYNILEILKELNGDINAKKHIIISLATGILIDEIQNNLTSSPPIFRAMPNTGADVGESMTCICSNSNDSKKIDLVKQVFDSIGKTILIDENLMNASTVLGACGIAYVLRFIRGMIQGGIQIGFDAKTASEIVTHTVRGASELLIKRRQHPEFEIDKVTTPKGCTIEGLNEMEHHGFSSSLIKGIVTSFDKIEK
ncbi:MAG: pyrroline-5-carboxylate reductase [Candidatus Marinimicrobia bacterium]|nr:pyrroline-5-carboxylate reductase [Candidatus Neomarinimicrobiota bacterium]